VTWEAVTIAVWVVIAAVLAALTWSAERPESSVASMGAAGRRLLARPAGRAGVILLWMWLGWHAFAR